MCGGPDDPDPVGVNPYFATVFGGHLQEFTLSGRDLPQAHLTNAEPSVGVLGTTLSEDATNKELDKILVAEICSPPRLSCLAPTYLLEAARLAA